MKSRASGKTTKRQKIVSAGEVADAAAENTFAGMPLDIILLFLLFMTPAELLALCDVNKALRRMLDSGTKAVAIWAKSREYHGIPAPFEGFTERTWARFIFGRICEECGINESREPDFGLMMRLCPKCRSEGLCQDLDFSVESDEEDEMGPILEFEDTFPHSHWYKSRDEILDYAGRVQSRMEQLWWAPYCWDILPIVRQARRGHKGAAKELSELHTEGERRLEHARICDKWREDVEGEERRTKIEALTAKFKALGYQDAELNGLDDYKMLAQFNLPLTDHAWEDMRGKLEGSIKDKRRDRLLQEHPDIMNGRQILAREAYMAYVRTLSPTEATYVPTVAGLKYIPRIRAICEREPSVEVTGADFADVPFIIANWVADKRARLTELANNNTASGTTGGSNFNLASTIFRCKIEHEKLGRPAMFGGDEAMRHVGQSCAPELDVPLSTLVSELVVLLELDPNIMTVADMDRHTVRFRCDGRANYSQCAKDIRHTMHVFTWRGCVTHAIKNHEYGSKRESWFRGSSDDGYYKNGPVNFVAVPEDVAACAVGLCHDDLPKVESFSWVCGHCTEYVGGPETLQGVTAHVKAVHGKPTPDGLDIPLAPGVLSISSSYSIQGFGAAVARPRRTNNNNNGAFRCLRCENSSRRFAGVGPVSDHLKGKHKIVNAVCDVDYGSAT
ncbi:hypothetical protein B0H19DRAFT_1088280 [Mycena capillaripes]|nr:hypothetical protein B0H19DRAFT_1088280 [Mycena capillaripes]